MRPVVTSSPDLSRELPVHRDFIRRRPSRFAGSTPYGARFRRSACLYGVPASSAGSGASLLPHPMDLINPWAILSSEHGAPSSGTSQPNLLKAIFKLCSFILQLKLGVFWAPFL